MQLANTSTRYGAVSQTLHWVTAALVVILIVSGKAGDIDADEGNALYFWHSSLGLLVLLLVIARIVWRLVTAPPKQPATSSRLAGRAAVGLHLLFYVFLVALPLSGWLAASAEGGAVSFFGIATLPQWSAGTASTAPVAVEEGERAASLSRPGESGEGGDEFFEEAHEVLGNILLILVILHALAALKHHFIDKDDVLLRMLPASRKSVRSSGDRGSHAPQGSP